MVSLHKKINSAQDIGMWLWIVLSSIALLMVVPIVIGGKIYIDVLDVKAEIQIRIFGWIPIDRNVCYESGHFYIQQKSGKKRVEFHMPTTRFEKLIFGALSTALRMRAVDVMIIVGSENAEHAVYGAAFSKVLLAAARGIAWSQAIENSHYAVRMTFDSRLETYITVGLSIRFMAIMIGFFKCIFRKK